MSNRSALDVQVGGSHYKDSKIQPVEYIHANGIGFMEGSAIKYLSRHTKKNGRQDVEKALHFCQLLLDLHYPVEKIEDDVKRVQLVLTHDDRSDLVMEIAHLIHSNPDLEQFNLAGLKDIKRQILEEIEEQKQIYQNALKDIHDDEELKTESGHIFQD